MFDNVFIGRNQSNNLYAPDNHLPQTSTYTDHFLLNHIFRGLIPTTVVTHLIDGIKMGYRIKLIDLNVTDEIRDTVVSVIRSPAIKSGMNNYYYCLQNFQLCIINFFKKRFTFIQ